MSNKNKGEQLEENQRPPTVVAKYKENASIAARFEAIGDRSRFRVLLQHFRFQFVLARCEEIDNLKWWLIAES